MINNIREMPRCSYMMILQDIEKRSEYFECVQFVHEGRDSNREHHMLAKIVCTLENGRHVRLGSPPILLCSAGTQAD